MYSICRRVLLVLLALLALLGLLVANASLAAQGIREWPSYINRNEVQLFIEEMIAKHNLPRGWLELTFARARFQPGIVRLMEPLPRGQRSWQVYRSRFVHSRNIEDGVRFWTEHRDALARAAAQYGVPPEIILAIIGIETQYGRMTGTFRVIDALSTLAFDYPRRAVYFRGELEQFLLYARESGVDPNGIRGSFAGAVGIPQFMPGSYRRFAVDFDGDGRRDLLASPADAIGSVANFLREHGWIPGEPVAFPAEVEGEQFDLLLAAGIRPSFRAEELADYGVHPVVALDPNTLVALIELETPDRPSLYYVGLANFYAITRYNQSSFYAIAVLELAQALRNAAGFMPHASRSRSDCCA